jgi:hypothetical protein
MFFSLRTTEEKIAVFVHIIANRRASLLKELYSIIYD